MRGVIGKKRLSEGEETDSGYHGEGKRSPVSVRSVQTWEISLFGSFSVDVFFNELKILAVNFFIFRMNPMEMQRKAVRMRTENVYRNLLIQVNQIDI